MSTLHPYPGQDLSDAYSLMDHEVGRFKVGDKVRVTEPAAFAGNDPTRTYTIEGFIVDSNGIVCATFAEVDTYEGATSPDMSSEIRGLTPAV